MSNTHISLYKEMSSAGVWLFSLGSFGIFMVLLFVWRSGWAVNEEDSDAGRPFSLLTGEYIKTFPA